MLTISIDFSMISSQSNISLKHKGTCSGPVKFTRPYEFCLENLTDMNKLAHTAAYVSLRVFNKLTSVLQGTSFTHIHIT
jgi:hypothetical protein